MGRMCPCFGLLLSVALTASACSATTPRARRVQGDLDGLVYSNGVMLEYEHAPLAVGDELAVDYSVLLSNHGLRLVQCNLRKVRAELADRDLRIECRGFGERTKTLSLDPGKTQRADCRITLPKVHSDRATRPNDLKLLVPVESEGRIAELVFPYRLEAKDFE